MTTTTQQRNVSAKIEGDVLIVEVPLAPAGSRSASGKTRTVATTRGNKTVGLADGTVIKIGLNSWYVD
jgi:hypothetical protein